MENRKKGNEVEIYYKIQEQQASLGEIWKKINYFLSKSVKNGFEMPVFDEKMKKNRSKTLSDRQFLIENTRFRTETNCQFR